MADTCSVEKEKPGFTNIFAEREELPNHESGGGRNTVHGFRYQFLVIMMWILRALKSPLDFTVSTEENRLDKFDDFALTQKTSEGQIVSQTFVQVKHSTKDAQISFRDLFSETLDLRIYFKSFMKIEKENIPTKYILYTNRDLDYGSKTGDLQLNINIFDVESEIEIFHKNIFKFKSKFECRNHLVKKILGNSEYSESDVDEFLSNFYIIVKGDSISDLETGIMDYFEEYMSKRDGVKCFNKYSVDFEKWYLSKKGTIIPKKLLETYFQSLKDEITQKEHFNLLAPNTNFFGRDDNLLEIENNIILEAKKEQIDVAITGTAAIGKSELVRKFASQFNEAFQHIFWFNAETKDTLQASYVELLKYFCIPIKDEKREENIESIIRTVNDLVRHRKCLFIFDNAELFMFNEFSTFLSDNKKHRIILTSQIQDWPCTSEIHLDVFSKEDAVHFLEKNLPFESNNRETLHEIANMLSYLPYALQLSVAYVSNMCKRKALLGQIYTLQNFQLDYKVCNDIFLNLKFNDVKKFDNYKKSLYLAWQLALDSISSDNNGDKAIEMLQIMSFLDADNISVQIFNKKFMNVLEDSIYLLTSYSLIKCENGVCSIHRLLQDVIRAKIDHTSSSNSEGIVRKSVDSICSIIYGRDRIPNMSNHILNIWKYIKDVDNEKTWFFLLDEKFRTTEFLSNMSIKSMEIYKSKITFLTQNRNYNKSLHLILYTLQKIFEVVSSCRNFMSAIPVFETYLKFKDFDLTIQKDSFLNLVIALSFCYYQVGNYEKSISLYDKMECCLEKIKRMEFLLKHRYIHKIYKGKAHALIWQHRYEEAAQVLYILLIKLARPEFRNQEFKYKEADYMVVSYFTNPWHSKELRYLFVNLLYIIDKDKLCHGMLHIFASTFSEFSESTIDSLRMRARLYHLQGNVKDEILILETIFDKMYHKALIVMQENNDKEAGFDALLYTIARNLRDESTIASFKRGSLNTLCKNINKYLHLLKQHDLVRKHELHSVTTLQLQLANLWCKNGNFTKSIEVLQEMILKLRHSISTKTDGNDAHFYQESVCALARAHYYSGDFKKAIQILNEEIADTSVIPLFQDKIFFLVFTKCDILLMEYSDETQAIEYLKMLISELNSKETAYCHLQYKISEIYAYRGNKELALKILNEIEELSPDESYVKLCMIKPLQLDLLEFLETENFFETYEESIQTSHNYLVHMFSQCYNLSTEQGIRDTIGNCDRLKCNVFNMISIPTEPFAGNYDYITKRLTIVYMYMKLQEYDKSLQELQIMKMEKLQFVFHYSFEMNKDISRIEKLVIYRRDKDINKK